MSKKLFIFIEGKHDETFFKEAIVDLIKDSYEDIYINQFSERGKINQKIDSFNPKMVEYIFVADFDYKHCYTLIKEKCRKSYAKNIDLSKIYVVKPEIEAWLIAGLNGKAKKALGITKPVHNTDNFTKEKFDSITPKSFEKSKIDFIQEILKHHSIEETVQKNTSFRYFYEKFLKNKVKVS